MWFCCGSYKCVFCYSITKIENNNLEPCYAVKFCVRCGEGATNTHEKIQKAFGNDSLSRAQVFRCHRGFVNGWETLEDDPRSGCPACVWTSTNATMWGLSFIEINIWQFQWSPMNLLLMNVRSTKLLHKIWTWEKCVQRWFQRMWMTVKKHIETKYW
jgi:hypothetical protein